MEHTVDRERAKGIKIVQQIDPNTGEVINEFYSVRKCANVLGFPSLFSNIAKVCREGGTVKGYMFRYEQL